MAWIYCGKRIAGGHIHTTPAMYLALSLMRSARRIAGADEPVSNSDRP
ncbi:hypothetical protein [uncultured Stenotrophomonas sp.]|nr:hypothetical protein [uncultured Stenotrophomonas sp.]HDS1579521.1 hypothetical protein [Stenotrophomonas maltophilia]